MWALLSRRLRRWLLIALALPLARLLVHELAVMARRRDPNAIVTQVLAAADWSMSKRSRLIRRH
jgi:hypothetical protein